MMETKLCFDKATVDNKILVDDNDYLVMPAVIASEIVHRYEDGWAYKPASELEKMAETASAIGAVPIKILGHPSSDTYDLVLKHDDVHGRAENFRYVKNLVDPKTKRPCRKGVRADLRWFKSRVPEPIITQIRDASLHDVSIGFTFAHDATKGDWNGIPYDYVQRNIFLQHVAAPIEAGRCPGPVCGIGFDKQIEIAGDPWEETEENIRSGHKEASEECKTITISEEEGIKAVYCNYGEDWSIQSYLFSKAHEWTLEKAQGWFNSHKNESVDSLIALSNCDLCKEMDKLGFLEVSKRLAKAFGKDAYYAVMGETRPRTPEPSEQTTEELLVEARRVIDSARWLFEQ